MPAGCTPEGPESTSDRREVRRGLSRVERHRRNGSAILRETGVMERLTNDLRLVSRVEAGRIELHLQDLDVNTVLSTREERFQPLAERRGVTFEVERPSMNLLVHADQERTAQVLANLV